MAACTWAHTLSGSALPCSYTRCSHTPPQAAFTGRKAAHAILHTISSSAASTTAPAASAGSEALRCSSTRCLAVSSSSSNIGSRYTRDTPTPYKWSWQDDSEPSAALELDRSGVDAASTVTDLTAVLEAAATVAPTRADLTPASRAMLNAAVQRVLLYGGTAAAAAAGTAPRCTAGEAARLLQAYGSIAQGAASSPSSSGSASATEAPSVVVSVLSQLCSHRSQSEGGSSGPAVGSASARELADLLWALSELQEDLPWDERTVVSAAGAGTPAAPSAEGEGTSPVAAAAASEAGAMMLEAPAALQRAVLLRIRNQDFLAQDLCRAVCALGSLAVSSGTAPGSLGVSVAGSSSNGGADNGSAFRLDPELVKAVNEEIRFQLTEFDSDFEAADLGRLISGMAGLRLGSAVAGDEEYRRILMKAVYGKTRSISDKASVDFALSRLMSDDPEARSMHYDSRWTHEELHWLPRRERDKRRILKEGWYRTKWGGWSPRTISGCSPGRRTHQRCRVRLPVPTKVPTPKTPHEGNPSRPNRVVAHTMP